MGENSKIEWTHHTFNPWIGCQNVSPGCDHCYAEAMMDHRYGRVQWGPHGERKRTSAGYWRQPYKWANESRGLPGRRRVFCASLADVFDNQVPTEWRDDLWTVIYDTPQLDWLLLTKRPQNIRKMLPANWSGGYPNVWLGTTCEDQKHYDLRWPVLRTIPAIVRFISYEPAIGPLTYVWGKPDWIICGGESGPDARYMEPSWAATVRDQCAGSGIAFFMKQMTGKKPIPDHLMIREFPAGADFQATAGLAL